MNITENPLCAHACVHLTEAEITKILSAEISPENLIMWHLTEDQFRAQLEMALSELVYHRMRAADWS